MTSEADAEGAERTGAAAAIERAAAALLEAEEAVNAATLSEPDRRKVEAWLSFARTNVLRAKRARSASWRQVALDDVHAYTDSVKHLIALRAGH